MNLIAKKLKQYQNKIKFNENVIHKTKRDFYPFSVPRENQNKMTTAEIENRILAAVVFDLSQIKEEINSNFIKIPNIKKSDFLNSVLGNRLTTL